MPMEKTHTYSVLVNTGKNKKSESKFGKSRSEGVRKGIGKAQ